MSGNPTQAILEAMLYSYHACMTPQEMCMRANDALLANALTCDIEHEQTYGPRIALRVSGFIENGNPLAGKDDLDFHEIIAKSDLRTNSSYVLKTVVTSDRKPTSIGFHVGEHPLVRAIMIDDRLFIQDPDRLENLPIEQIESPFFSPDVYIGMIEDIDEATEMQLLYEREHAIKAPTLKF